MKIFEFKVVPDADKSQHGPFLIAFPADKIDKIESRYGSENVYLKVNGVRVYGSYT